MAVSGGDERVLIKIAVWSGFFSAEDLGALIEDLVLDDADLDATSLRALARHEFARKAEAEMSWPQITDCDRLDQAFDRLGLNGVLALHDAGVTMSDGHADAAEMLAARPKARTSAIVFTTGKMSSRPSVVVCSSPSTTSTVTCLSALVLLPPSSPCWGSMA